jgi:hypothetical protein
MKLFSPTIYGAFHRPGLVPWAVRPISNGAFFPHNSSYNCRRFASRLSGNAKENRAGGNYGIDDNRYDFSAEAKIQKNRGLSRSDRIEKDMHHTRRISEVPSP